MRFRLMLSSMSASTVKKAFRAIGIGFANIRSFVRHQNSSSNISKAFDLESPNCMGTSVPTLSTATPDMTSLAISGREKIAHMCKFVVICGSRFLDNGSTDSKTFYIFGNGDSMGSFPLLQCIRYFCSLTPKIGLKWAYLRLRVTLMAYIDFLGNYYCQRLRNLARHSPR